MSCAKIRFLIQSCVDGAATRAEHAEVEAHITSCTACACELAEVRRFTSLLAGMPERRVSERFEQNLAAALRECPPAPAGVAWWERFRLHFEWRLRVPAMVAAGSLACVLVAAMVTLQLTERRTEQVERQQERRKFVVTAVERHQQLERADSHSDWDAMDASIDLSTGSIVTD